MDEMFHLFWHKYRTWADTSARLKKANATWKRNVLALTIGGTALATLGPFAGGTAGRVLPMLGAAALALATYFGKELLDTRHGEQWTRARAAAETLKSDAHKYLVGAPPYDGADRVTRLKARMADVIALTKDQTPHDMTPEQAAKGMPSSPWTIDNYIAHRLDEQVTWYRDRARQHTSAMRKGRVISLSLGAAAVVLSAVTGATADGATLIGAVLGVVTTAGGSIGAYFHAGQYEAIALRYRESADSLVALKADFKTGITAHSPGEFVTAAEAIMQAENAGWLTQVIRPAAT
jgi:hypothetical protein